MIKTVSAMTMDFPIVFRIWNVAVVVAGRVENGQNRPAAQARHEQEVLPAVAVAEIATAVSEKDRVHQSFTQSGDSRTYQQVMLAASSRIGDHRDDGEQHAVSQRAARSLPTRDLVRGGITPEFR